MIHFLSFLQINYITFSKKDKKAACINFPLIDPPFTFLLCFKVAKMDDTAEGLTLPLYTHTHTHTCIYPQRNAHQCIAQHL